MVKFLFVLATDHKKEGTKVEDFQKISREKSDLQREIRMMQREFDPL